MKKYINDNREFTASNQVIESNCNEITFINKGTETAYINDFPIAQDESLELDGKAGEMDITKYVLRFSTGGGTQSLWVFRKTYK